MVEEELKTEFICIIKDRLIKEYGLETDLEEYINEENSERHLVACGRDLKEASFQWDCWFVKR